MQDYKLTCTRRVKGVEQSTHVVDTGSKVQCHNAKHFEITNLVNAANMLGTPIYITDERQALHGTQFVFFNHMLAHEIELQFVVSPL